MCGRYILTTPLDGLRALFDVIERINLEPRWNIAPTQDAPVVRLGEDGRKHLSLLRWGLVPEWAADPSVGARAINARSETIATKPTFREAFRRRRCLVPADAYYEWEQVGDKQPFRFARADGGVMALAGLWERWQAPDRTAIDSYALATVDASADVLPICERMPVLLAPEQQRAWLDPHTSQTDLFALLRTAPAGTLTRHPVSRRVNSARLEGPDLAAPVEQVQPRFL